MSQNKKRVIILIVVLVASIAGDWLLHRYLLYVYQEKLAEKIGSSGDNLLQDMVTSSLNGINIEEEARQARQELAQEHVFLAKLSTYHLFLSIPLVLGVVFCIQYFMPP